MVGELVVGGVYQHYKAKNYRVRDLARDADTGEALVVYECLYDNPGGKLWVRPLRRFLETIDVGGRTVSRFRYIGDQKGRTRL